MNQNGNIIDRMRIASPCPMNWEAMKGDNRARFCDLCTLNVYNISEMSTKEVNALIARTEGRICARLFKRSDGTVITKDCPIGLRAVRRRISRVTGALVTSILSICVSALGKSSQDNLLPGSTRFRITRMNSGLALQTNRSGISGRVVDPNGAVISGAVVKITNQNTGKQSQTETKADGTFRFVMLTPGKYRIEIEATAFNKYDRTDFELGDSETISEEIVLEVGAFVGLLTYDQPEIIDPGSSNRTVFSSKQIRSLPY